jgi:hypothetical protein
MTALIVATMWTKILPVGIRTAMFTMLVCWLGKIYVIGIGFLANWSALIVFSYQALRYIVGGLGILLLVYIVVKK